MGNLLIELVKPVQLRLAEPRVQMVDVVESVGALSRVAPFWLHHVLQAGETDQVPLVFLENGNQMLEMRT